MSFRVVHCSTTGTARRDISHVFLRASSRGHTLSFPHYGTIGFRIAINLLQINVFFRSISFVQHSVWTSQFGATCAITIGAKSTGSSSTSFR